MPRKKDTAKKVPEQLFRYWVEIRKLDDDTVRRLPLTAAVMVPLVDPPMPSKRLLRIRDEAGTLQAETFEELRLQLRQRYPDDGYVRTIHWERDIAAEQRRDRALNALAQLMAETAVEEALREQQRTDAKPREAITTL
jgi:hypothetical protein